MVLSNKAKARRKQTRRERYTAGIFYCRLCGKRLTSNDVHHTMHNACWNKAHPREALINRKKAGKW